MQVVSRLGKSLSGNLSSYSVISWLSLSCDTCGFIYPTFFHFSHNQATNVKCKIRSTFNDHFSSALVHALPMFRFVFLSGSTRPVITPDGSQHAVQLNGNFTLHCHCDAPVHWLREERPNRILREEQRGDHLSTVFVDKAWPQHQGKYICLDESTGETSSIYVFVTGK